MKVCIEGNLYLESDTRQYIIKEYTGKKSKDGEELYNVHGYFSSIQSAVKHLLKMLISKSTSSTLEELLQDVKRIEKFINSKIDF